MLIAVQKALVARLKSQVSGVAGRVYDRVEPQAKWPHVEIGALDLVEADGECLDAATVTATIHVWSQGRGAVECRELCAAIRTALRGFQPDMSGDGFEAGPFRIDQIRDQTDDGGVTHHGIVVVSVDVDKH